MSLARLFPDLNVINLWAIFKKSVNFGAIRDADSMFEEAARAWNNIPMETVNKLTADFEPRLHACIAVAGQCLNMHHKFCEASAYPLRPNKRLSPLL